MIAGTAVGVFSWAGGLGGFSSVSGVDLQQALEYRRAWRFYPTSLIPVEDYERAIGRKAYPEDFADINAIMGEERVAIPTDVVGIQPIPPPKTNWWKEVLDKAKAEEDNSKK